MPLESIPQPYQGIIQQNYSDYITDKDLNSANLKKYFDEGFNRTIQQYGDYICWVCVNCMALGVPSFGWGEKPQRCPQCKESKTYEVATFQGRASRMGSIFAWSFYYLMDKNFSFKIYPTPEGTNTHDFEITQAIAIETKGSPSYIINPDGTRVALGEPGLMRTDTEKKAFANAAKYRQRKPDGYFCIVTNALPKRLLRYSDRDINAIYDITKKEQLELFLRDIKEIIK